MRSELGGKLPGQDSPHRNSLSGQAEETHRETLSHALPTSDPDLAFEETSLSIGPASPCLARVAQAIRAGIVVMVKAASADTVRE
jgi:hypothetical protein